MYVVGNTNITFSKKKKIYFSVFQGGVSMYLVMISIIKVQRSCIW